MRLLGNGSLAPFALGDINCGANDAIALAFLVEEAASLGGDPADYAILLADGAVLDVVERAG
jgi:hypothetical protein